MTISFIYFSSLDMDMEKIMNKISRKIISQIRILHMRNEIYPPPSFLPEYIDRESLKPLKPPLREQKSIPISIAFIIALLSAT